MKNNFLITFLFIIVLASIILIGLLYNYNQNLNDVINSKDKLLKEISAQDSALIETTKEYSDIITRYTYENEFLIDGKKISAKDIVTLFNNLLEENAKLKDSLYYCQTQAISGISRTEYYKKKYFSYFDSTSFYKLGFKSAMKDYGIQYDIKRNDSVFIVKRLFTKADSALLLFPFYKNQIRKDPLTDNWIITYEEKVPANTKQKK